MIERQNKRGRRAGLDSSMQQQTNPSPRSSSGGQDTPSVPSTSQSSSVQTGQLVVRGRGGYRTGQTDRDLVTIPKNVTTVVANANKSLRFITNHVRINFNDKGQHKVILYRVDFEPSVESEDIRFKLIKQYTVQLFNNNYTYDRGNDLHSAIVLPKEVTTVQAKHPADGAGITITIKNTGSIDKFNYIRLFNSQMNEFLRKMGYFKIRDSYYHHELTSKLPGDHGLSLIGGFNTSTNVLDGGIMVSLESKNRLIQDLTVYHMIQAMSKNSRENFKDRIRGEITGLDVLTKYNNRTYKIEDIKFDMSPQSTFRRDDGTEQSYIDYYQRSHNLTVRDKKQPMLQAQINVQRGRRREAALAGDAPGSSEDRPVRTPFLIPEFCHLTSLTKTQKNDTNLKMTMIRNSQVSPDVKVQSLRQFLNKINTDQHVKAKCKSWNYSYENNLAEVPGRQLEQVEVLTGTSGRLKSTRCKDGSFDNALRGTELYNVPSLQYLTIILGRRSNDPSFDEVTRTIQQSMDAVGLKLRRDQVKMIPLQDISVRSYLTELRQIPDKTTIVLCLLPDASKDRYDAIKRFLSVERGIPSQCFLTKLFRNGEQRARSASLKIAIQIACKIGGVPWSIKIPPSAKFMICGYDAWHDSVDNSHSWGAFCSSLNTNFTRWWSKADKHTGVQELSSNLANNVFMGVVKYREYNKHLPDKIIIYRDGVGVGQLDHVFNVEVKQIKTDLEKEAKQKIKLAIVVVTKRIGTRFFLKQGNRCENPPPGTVIDTDITRKTHYDFFLVSHYTRNGTISPTMYNIIEDDTGLKPEVMQTIAYSLCHLYFNWSGAVRVPAPCQYAHKLAYLMGESLHLKPHINLDNYLHYL